MPEAAVYENSGLSSFKDHVRLSGQLAVQAVTKAESPECPPEPNLRTGVLRPVASHAEAALSLVKHVSQGSWGLCGGMEQIPKCQGR